MARFPASGELDSSSIYPRRDYENNLWPANANFAVGELLSTGMFQAEADINGDGSVNLLDVDPFIELLNN